MGGDDGAKYICTTIRTQSAVEPLQAGNSAVQLAHFQPFRQFPQIQLLQLVLQLEHLQVDSLSLQLSVRRLQQVQQVPLQSARVSHQVPIPVQQWIHPLQFLDFPVKGFGDLT